MSLKDLSLKGLYDSDKDDLLNDFYIPVLSESIIYKRVAGFFSSNALAIAAKGIVKFIENGGTIQLIANVILSEKDQEEIKKAIKEKESEIINEIENLEDTLKKGQISLLGWMIKNDKLEIKIAVVQKGIEHKKKGVLEDKEGNKISFSGSDNETLKGWIENDEEFHVFCSWREEEANRHLNPDIKGFDYLWNDEAKKVKVYPVSEAFRRGLVKTAPKNDEKFKELSKEVTEKLLKKNKEIIENKKEIQEVEEKQKEQTEELILRGYQSQAVDDWFKNKEKGFFRMATGTGKTETAIGVIKQLLEKDKSFFVIIVVHGQSLLNQWINKLKKYGFSSRGASSTFPNWRKEFRKEAMGVSLGYEKLSIFVTTYQTFSSEDFVTIVKTLECNTLLTCDEVHHAGAPKFRKGLIRNYLYRLGLSATPERWFDEEGTSFLENYFGKTAYSFSMKRAMSEINPATKKTYLCQYRYHPILVNLTIEENEEFIELSKKIGRRYHLLGEYDRKDSQLLRLALKRSDIKKNARLKIHELEKLFVELGDSLEYCIIYCTGKQMNDVKDLLQKYNRIYCEFTQHQKPAEREKILKEFKLGREKGGYNVILAIDCLNEGIDIPSAKIGIFLENSLNPIEFIQRRGRLLRQSNNKKEAIMYDFIVEPSFEGLDDKDYWEKERKEIQKEFDRFIEFSHLSLNTQESLEKMKNIIKKYSLVIRVREENDVL
ncbi:MAG: DEAD/DEAH box helicase family protein [Nanoarchaeota archaeon]|nr:DEAD/DEAH box helicase family protein [DPANN group archaeon]MBL7116866.1 DEAD/DEAH box helicase family protein [Nanoarchaeota archaeon]